MAHVGVLITLMLSVGVVYAITDRELDGLADGLERLLEEEREESLLKRLLNNMHKADVNKKQTNDLFAHYPGTLTVSLQRDYNWPANGKEHMYYIEYRIKKAGLGPNDGWETDAFKDAKYPDGYRTWESGNEKGYHQIKGLSNGETYEVRVTRRDKDKQGNVVQYVYNTRTATIPSEPPGGGK